MKNQSFFRNICPINANIYPKNVLGVLIEKYACDQRQTKNNWIGNKEYWTRSTSEIKKTIMIT